MTNVNATLAMIEIANAMAKDAMPVKSEQKMPSKKLRQARKEAKAFMKTIQEYRAVQAQIDKSLATVGLSGIVAEALDVLEDQNLEFSGEMDLIRQPLANLMRLAVLYPMLQPSVESLAKTLLTGDVLD